MDVLGWLVQFIQEVLSKSAIPQWLIDDVIIPMVKRLITQDSLVAIEQQCVCFICQKLDLLVGSNPDPVLAQLVTGIKGYLNCQACNPAPAPTPAPAPGP